MAPPAPIRSSPPCRSSPDWRPASLRCACIPCPFGRSGWLAARRRDLVPVLGLRTIGRRSGAANLPLLALMLTAAFGTFTSIVASSLEQGQLVTTYLETGADYRLEPIGANPFTNLDPTSIPGVDAGAAGYVDPSARFAGTPRQLAKIDLEAVDPGPYAAVTAGTPADPRWPASFLADPLVDGLGTEANPIPAILSNRLPSGTAQLALGDVFQMTVARQSMSFRIVERRDRFAGIDSRIAFAVVPFNWVRAAHEAGSLLPTRMWLRGPADAAGAVATAIAESAGNARIVSRHDAYGALHGASMGQAVIVGYGLALVVAAIYMALTIIGSLILSAARRTRDLAYLRTLGVSAPQSLGLTVMEHAPPVLIALVPGIALGIGVAVLTLPEPGPRDLCRGHRRRAAVRRRHDAGAPGGRTRGRRRGRGHRGDVALAPGSIGECPAHGRGLTHVEDA